MVKKVMTDLDSTKYLPSCDCILVVVLKNWEPELLFILAYLFNMFLKEFCFLDCYKVLPVDSVKFIVMNYCHASFLSAICKLFEKLVNNSLADHLKKYGLFSDFKYCIVSGCVVQLQIF